MKVKLPIIYSQLDPKWKNNLLGFNTQPQYNFGNYACLVASLASIATYYGKQNIDPIVLNEELKRVQGYQEGTALYIQNKFTELFPDITEKRVASRPLTDEQMNEVKNALDAGYPVVLGIDYNPRTLTYDSHFVIAVDYDPNDENNITIADPIGARIHPLRDFFGGDKNSSRAIIYQYHIFTGQVNQTVSAPTPQPQSALPENFPQIIHGSTQWDEVVKFHVADRKPSEVFFRDLADKLKPIEIVKEVVKEVPVEKIVEKVVEVAVPATDENHAGIQWDQTVSYLEIGKEPKDAVFEDVKRVIAGIKSRTTDFENKAKEAKIEVEKKDTEILNLKDEIRRLNNELLTEKKLHKAQITNLKDTQPNFDKLSKQFEGVISELRGELKEAHSIISSLRIDLSVKRVEDQEASGTREPEASGFFIARFIKGFFNI